jgi:hypothetical protein
MMIPEPPPTPRILPVDHDIQQLLLRARVMA